MSSVPLSPRTAALMAHITNLQRETQTEIRRVSEELGERITLVERRVEEPIPHNELEEDEIEEEVPRQARRTRRHEYEEDEGEEEIPRQERRPRRNDRRHRQYDNEYERRHRHHHYGYDYERRHRHHSDEEDRRQRWEEEYWKKKKLNIPNFQGKGDPELYLDWELKVEQIFSCHEVREERKVSLATLEFTDYALLWWDQQQKERARCGARPIEYWEDLKAMMRKRYVPSHYTRVLHDVTPLLISYYLIHLKSEFPKTVLMHPQEGATFQNNNA